MGSKRRRRPVVHVRFKKKPTRATLAAIGKVVRTVQNNRRRYERARGDMNGGQFRDARLLLKRSQEGMGLLLGKSRRTIVYWEREENRRRLIIPQAVAIATRALVAAEQPANVAPQQEAHHATAKT